MQTINERIASDREDYAAGVVLENQDIPLDFGAFSEPTCSTMRAGIWLRIQSSEDIPKNTAFSIVDNNASIQSGSSVIDYPLIIKSSQPDSRNNGISISECVVNLLGGSPSLTLKIRSTSPVLAGSLQVSHKIYARTAE